MAPGTHIGAAAPVDISGRGRLIPLPSDNPSSATDLITSAILQRSIEPIADPKDAMSEKIMNDTLAWAETIARVRGRNADWARKAVSRAESITADEALRLGVVDFIAPDLDTLLRDIDGRKVRVEGGEFIFHTAGAPRETVELTTRQRILNVLANPNLAYMLLLAGLAGLLYEITHPGLIFPGVAGLVSLLLAALSLNLLPTNYAAILLIIAGVALIIAEIKFTTYGLLTVAGTICLFFGSLALFDSSGTGVGVSLTLVIPTIAVTVGLLVLLVFLVVRSHARRPATGEISFAGQTAEVVVTLSPAGKVFFDGTLWDATAPVPVPKGAQVRIVRAERFHLYVEPI